MSRNVESHFAKLPQAEIGRSRFDRSSTHKTTFNAGKLVPIYVDEVLPGDTFSMDVASLVRMSTPIFPVMDNAYLDTYFFFVPNRLVWEHWKEFNGENNETYWTQPVEYSVPTLSQPYESYDSDNNGWNKGSVADYLGIPTEVCGESVNALPFRAYALIWNEWFRDQNTMAPAEFYRDDSNRVGIRSSNGSLDDARLSAHLGGDLLPVCKYHDYFTSALPAPQKGPAVSVPFEAGLLPVYSLSRTGPSGDAGANFTDFEPLFIGDNVWNSDSLRLYRENGQLGSSGSVNYKYGEFYSDGVTPSVDPDTNLSLYPGNLYAVPGENFAPTINSLRQAFQIQKLFEKDARGGTRYTEILKAHFGVDSPDARLQRPEYLGGKRIPINIDQVLQTSSTDSTSPQGNAAAYSLTVDTDSSFVKSFTEHGFIIGLCCVRTDHTYQQGLDRMWSRKRRFDFYWPALANLGEQAILSKELGQVSRFPGDSSVNLNDAAFGYQEAWAEYRYKPSRVSGAFRSNYAQTLDSWHYADYYDLGTGTSPTPVYLSEEWMQETDVNIDRTLAVSSEVEDQFIADFYFKCDCVRPMPLYSIPGLIDHH